MYGGYSEIVRSSTNVKLTNPSNITEKCFLPKARPWWIPGTQLFEMKIMTVILGFLPPSSSSDKARIAPSHLTNGWNQAEDPVRTDVVFAQGQGHFIEL